MNPAGRPGPSEMNQSGFANQHKLSMRKRRRGLFAMVPLTAIQISGQPGEEAVQVRRVACIKSMAAFCSLVSRILSAKT